MLDTEYEKKLRQSLCIFPALTAAVLAVFLAVGDFDEKRLHYHFDTITGTVMMPVLILVIFGGFTVAEMYSKTVFIFREVIRFIMGAGVVLYMFLMSIFNGVIMFFGVALVSVLFTMPFTLPLLIYWLKSKEKKKQEMKDFMEKIQKEEENDGQTE